MQENYNTLKHTHSLRPSDRHDIQDEIYGKLEEVLLSCIYSRINIRE